MLSVLKIQNIAIIENAEIEFTRGFNVLSGETGAGKSIILDSINAVLGFRTSRELIRTGEREARVTALFTSVGDNVKNKLSELSLPQSPDNSLLISRVISADGNICKVNNALTNVTALRELGTELMSIHGQQDNRELLNSETHIGYIDALVCAEKIVNEYRALYGELVSLKARIKKLFVDKAEKNRKIDMLSYQIDEIEKAQINPGEWERLKNRRTQLQNFEKIQSGVYATYSAMAGDDSFAGAVELLKSAFREISAVSRYSDDLGEIEKKLGDLYYEAEDVVDTLRTSACDEDFSQAELEDIENRINLIYNLSRKYGSSEEEILNYLENAKNELNEISFADEKLEELKVQCDRTYAEAMEKASELSALRKKAALDFSEKVCEELRFLDMPDVRFCVDFSQTELGENGIDEAQFLISANVGEAPKPMTKIASGGELSRIMLALKTVMAHKDKVETMIFDEIDSGVSGRAALKVASKLKEVSKGRQVLCVTHLAQLMTYADSHYLIEKSVKNGKTYTSVTLLDDEGRKKEIARITATTI